MQIWDKPLIKSGGVYGCIVWSWTIRLPAVILGVIESGGLASNRNSFCVSKQLNPLTSGGLFTQKMTQKEQKKWTLKHFFQHIAPCHRFPVLNTRLQNVTFPKVFFILFFYLWESGKQNKMAVRRWRRRRSRGIRSRFFLCEGWQKAHFAEGREGFISWSDELSKAFCPLMDDKEKTLLPIISPTNQKAAFPPQNHMLCFQLTVFFDPEAALRGSWNESRTSVWWLRAAKNHLIGFLDLFSPILSPARRFSTFKLAPRRGRATSPKPTSPKPSPLGEELLLLARFQGNSGC